MQHLLPFALNKPLFRCFLRFSAGALILGPTTLILQKLLLHVFAHFSKTSDVSMAKKECYVELPYKFIATYISSFLSTAVIPTILQHFNVW